MRITSALFCHCSLCFHLCHPPGITFCYSVNHSWEFHTEDRGGGERRRKRNNNKLNRVWTTTASQVSWIFAMNSKLNRSSLYYWQQNMLIVLIICAVFHGAISMNNSQTLLPRFKNNIQSAYTPAIAENTETWILCQSMAINEVCDPLSVIIDWSSIGRCQSMLINNNYSIVIDWLIDFPIIDFHRLFRSWFLHESM